MAARKPLLNYTTSVEPEASVAQVTKILIGHGASAISTEYDAGRPVGISFRLKSPDGRLDDYSLPVRIGRAHQVLQLQAKKKLIAPRYATRDHAARVAWRVAKDWIEVNLALAESGVVDLDEVMLPYLMQGGTTLYQHVVESRKALPAPGSNT